MLIIKTPVLWIRINFIENILRCKYHVIVQDCKKYCCEHSELVFDCVYSNSFFFYKSRFFLYAYLISFCKVPLNIIFVILLNKKRISFFLCYICAVDTSAIPEMAS